jgi:hypothetical protein
MSKSAAIFAKGKSSVGITYLQVRFRMAKRKVLIEIVYTEQQDQEPRPVEELIRTTVKKHGIASYFEESFMRRSLRCSRYTWNDRTKSHGFNTSRRNAVASWLYEELITITIDKHNISSPLFEESFVEEDRLPTVSLHGTT